MNKLLVLREISHNLRLLLTKNRIIGQHCKHMLKFVIFVIIAVAATFSPAVSVAVTQVPVDSSEVNVRQPDPDRIELYKNDPDFIYDEAAPEESIIGIIIREIFRFLDDLLGEGTGNVVMRTLFILALIGVAYLILSQMLSGQIKSALTGQSASEDVRFSRDPDSHTREDLDRMIEAAINSGNYREGVRLLYQKTLKELNTAGMIEWSPNKTNHDYLYEISAHPLSESFSKLTRIYEYTEYGDFGIDEHGFMKVRSLYGGLKKELSGGAGVKA